MIDFGVDFLVLLAPFWEPRWDDVGSIFGPHEWVNWVHPSCCCVHVLFGFIRRLDPILAPFWLHFRASGPHHGSILEVFGSMLAPFWRYVGPFGRKSWQRMGWWGYEKREELAPNIDQHQKNMPRCTRILIHAYRFAIDL